jgi:glycerate 2-kinase
MERTAIRSVSEIFTSALKAVSPYEAVMNRSKHIMSCYETDNFNRLVVIGFGKAACPMAKAIEDSLLDILKTGIVITKYNHCNKYILKRITVFEAGHPLPDENGFKGTDTIIRLLKNTDEHTFVVCLISGGGSALLVAPCDGITLHEKQKVTELLLKAGADIYELNTVRKHISKVKGGRFAEIVYPSRVISLILSDVIGDRLDVIASGPTSPDTTTYGDALRVLKKYGLVGEIPQGVSDFLNRGAEGLISETPKERSIIFEKIENIIIGSNRKALEAAEKKSECLGFNTKVISSEVTGDARKAGKCLAGKALEIKKVKKDNKPICLISGGETTVTVRGRGKGGRNMELALSFATEIEGFKGITLLSAGTDGTDGPTDAAGAIVDGVTIRKAKSLRLDPDEYLKNNDSYNFFKEIDGLFITGPTETNVMDIQIMVIE